jgi:hypothetical protein
LAAFVSTSFLFLALSVLAVHEVGAVIGNQRTPWRTFVLETITLCVFGIRWVMQFFLLDRVLFRALRSTPNVVGA